MKRIATIQSWIVGLSIIFFVLYSMVPTIYEWTNRGSIKPLRYFELVHNFPTDYNLYLSKIRQGKEGAWLAREKYTAEPHEGSLSQVLYVFIGKVSDWVHVQTPYIWFSYHAMRVFFAVVFLITIWKVVAWVFPTFLWQYITFLLIVTASTWPKFESVAGWPRFGGFMPWYTVVDSLQRTTFMPHVLLGQSLLIFVMWVFAGGFLSKNADGDGGYLHPGNWIFLGIVGIIMGIVFPPALFFVYGVLGFWSLYDIAEIFLKGRNQIQKKGRWRNLFRLYYPWIRNVFFARVLFVVMTFPTMVYYALLFADYPWKRLVEFDVLHPTKFSYVEYFLALGATLLMGCIGIIVRITRYIRPFGPNIEMEKKLSVFIIWVLSWLFFTFLFNFIPQQSPTRFSQMTPHVPLGILSMYAVYVGYGFMAQKWEKHQQDQVVSVFAPKDGLLFIPIVVILLGIGTMTSTILWLKDFVDHKLRADYPLVPKGAEVMYPLYDLVDALVWLQVHTPREAVVFSGAATGNLIPVYAGNTAHMGHANTVGAETKEIIVANVYGRKVPAADVTAYFKAQRIAYVLYGPEEAELAFGAFHLSDYYPFLREEYANKLVKVYSVQL